MSKLSDENTGLLSPQAAHAVNYNSEMSTPSTISSVNGRRCCDDDACAKYSCYSLIGLAIAGALAGIGYGFSLIPPIPTFGLAFSGLPNPGTLVNSTGFYPYANLRLNALGPSWGNTIVSDATITADVSIDESNSTTCIVNGNKFNTTTPFHFSETVQDIRVVDVPNLIKPFLLTCDGDDAKLTVSANTKLVLCHNRPAPAEQYNLRSEKSAEADDKTIGEECYWGSQDFYASETTTLFFKTSTSTHSKADMLSISHN
jgi:hypothetical protein